MYLTEEGNVRIWQLEEEVFNALELEGFGDDPQVGEDVSTTHFAWTLIQVMKENNLSTGNVVE